MIVVIGNDFLETQLSRNKELLYPKNHDFKQFQGKKSLKKLHISS